MYSLEGGAIDGGVKHGGVGMKTHSRVLTFFPLRFFLSEGLLDAFFSIRLFLVRTWRNSRAALFITLSWKTMFENLTYERAKCSHIEYKVKAISINGLSL